jgi:hypothetical protein
MVNNLIWVNPTGADLGSSANGSYNKPYSNIDYAYQSIANGINLNQNSDWFILLKPNSNLRGNLDFTDNNLKDYFNISDSPRRLYIIGMCNRNYNNSDEIINELTTNRIAPFIKSEFLTKIQQYKINNDFSQGISNFNNTRKNTFVDATVKLRGNITLVNLTFNSNESEIVLQNRNKTPMIYKCYFGTALRISEHGSTYTLEGDCSDAGDITSGYSINESDRAIINLCMFNNIYTTSSDDMTRKCALEINCSACDVYDNVFLNNDIGIIVNAYQDTTFDTNAHSGKAGVNIKNCKIFNSKYDGLIANFPGENNYVNKIINVDCSYTKEGNGFKVKNCNLIKCKASWNKYYGFILLGNKYLYRCHALNNQTGMLVASTTNCLFRKPYFKFLNHTEVNREYVDDNILSRKTNFFNCSVKGSLGGSGIVFSIYSSYSIIANCEISGNQGSLESFYDVVNYIREYYFTGGGIKGFRDNNLCLINTSIVGNLGYGICIIDDIKRILNRTRDTRTFYDYKRNEINSENYYSYYIVNSCNQTSDGNYNINSYEYNGSPDSLITGIYDEDYSYDTFIIDSDRANEHCKNFSNTLDAEAHVGHLILINSIISTNRGGQIIKLFDFAKTFPNRYINFNSLIDNYKSDKFFTLPKNICAWNPYKGNYEIGDGEDNKKFGLYDMVTIFNSVPASEGNYLMYRSNGIFKAFKFPDDVDNARDDLDLRIKFNINKDNLVYNNSEGDVVKVLEGASLFESNGTLKSSYLNDMNNKLNKKLNNQILNEEDYNFLKLFFNNLVSYLPNINHYFGDSDEIRDSNFINVNNKYFDWKNDSLELILNDTYEETHKQFLDITKFQNYNSLNGIQQTLKEILNLDFDNLSRDLENPYIGCFEKHNYCGYNFNNTGREFDYDNNRFTSEIDCCSNSGGSNCTVPVGIGNNYPPGLLKSLVVNYTEQDVSFELQELESTCQSLQDNLLLKEVVGPVPDLSGLEVSEDSCIFPNFEMYDFNGIFFESRFICGNDCKFFWYPWNKLLENQQSTTLLSAANNLDLHYRTGKLKKISEEETNNLESKYGVLSNKIIDAENLYPNICPSSGEFEYDPTNEELYCRRGDTPRGVQRWFNDKKDNNELPLIPDGCPEFGGKKCPVSNVQFVLLESEEDPDNLVINDHYSISNNIDDIISSDTFSIESVVNEISGSNEIDPSNPIYVEAQCRQNGYLSTPDAIENLQKNIRTYNYNPDNEQPINITKLIVIIIIMVIFIIVILLI